MTGQAAYLLSGERFLADEALARIRADEATDPLAEVSLDAGAPPAAITEALDTPSLMGGRRLVVVHEAHDLKKDAIAAVERYLASPNPSSLLVLIASKRSKLDAAVKASGAVITLDPPKGKGLHTWIRQRAGELGLKFDDQGARALIASVGTELRDIGAALQQLASSLGSGARVSTAEVKQMFSRLADERIYALTDGLGNRRLPDAMLALRRLLDQGEQPLVILGALTSHVRRMLQARAHVEQGPQAVGEALGLPAWRAKFVHKQTLNYREEELVAAMRALAQTDVELKGGDLPPEAALERAVVQIVTGSVPAPMF
jgi:DNA polymerase-3 subunit delta